MANATIKASTSVGQQMKQPVADTARISSSNIQCVFNLASIRRLPIARGRMIGRSNAAITRAEQRAGEYLAHPEFGRTPSIIKDERRIFQSDVRQHRQRHEGANRLRRRDQRLLDYAACFPACCCRRYTSCIPAADPAKSGFYI